MATNSSYPRIQSDAYYVIVEKNYLNNMARIIFQDTAITADQHRDLENMLAQVINHAEPYLEK